jgi:DNA mismatch endonuclease, patch repair protein
MDVYSPKKRSDVMRSIRSRDTAPEVALRKALFRLGYRYRLHVKSLPGKPDIVLPKYRVIVDVRGCFWHGHDCGDGHIPETRREYWSPKISGNMARDRNHEERLSKLGWKVLVVWGCECTPTRIGGTVGKISAVLRETLAVS